MPRAEVANWASTSGKLGEGRKAALQPQPVNLREFFRWKLIALVLTISILCLGDHFQWKKFSQSAVEVQFPGYRPFVLPTLFTRGSGNLTRWQPAGFCPCPLSTCRWDRCSCWPGSPATASSRGCRQSDQGDSKAQDRPWAVSCISSTPVCSPALQQSSEAL